MGGGGGRKVKLSPVHCGVGGMASLSAGKKLQEEAVCSICLDFFTDPVSLDCGHDFCQACIAGCWGDPPTNAACPECRQRVEPTDLRPNRKLANMVAIVKELSVQAEHQLGGWRVCERHQEPLKLFCMDDEAPICVVCDRAKEHRAHTVVAMEEAAQEYKDQFWGFLEHWRKGREEILACKADAEKESQNLLEQILVERGKAVVEFRQLHKFLEDQERLLLTQMEEVENEIARRRDEHMEQVSEELASLDNIIQEMEEVYNQSPSELLQDVRSTLQRCKEKERSENPAAFPPTVKWSIWDLRYRALIRLVRCRRSSAQPQTEPLPVWSKDNLISGFQPQEEAHITLDLNTAHPHLILAEDRKSVSSGVKMQNLPNSPERFSSYCVVLGCEGFTAGRHCWEVSLGSEGFWAVGVARKSVKRNEMLKWSPEGGIWSVVKRSDGYWAPNSRADVPLNLSWEPKKIRVAVHYAKGQVAFFDADSAATIYIFSKVTFSGETLLPLFRVSRKGFLTLSP